MPPEPPARGARRPRALLGARRAALLGATVLVLAIVGALDPRFVGLGNLRFMLLGSVVLSLLSLGQTVVICTGGIDLSVAPVLGLTALGTGLLAQNDGLALPLAAVLSVVVGLVLGTLNGALVARLAIPPIITTLGTYSLYSGLMFIVSDGDQVNTVPPGYAAFGNNGPLPFIPVPTPVLLLLAILALVAFLLGQTPLGRAVLAIGNNRVAAFNAGIRVRSVEISAYTLSGLLAAIAGLVFVCYTGSATVTTGTGDHLELQSIAVALIGGAAITGGRGDALGTVLGAVFLSVVLTALVFVHVPPIWYSAGEGLMILLAVTAGVERERRDA